MHIIRILRDHLGLTQTQLAQRSGISYTDLYRMEKEDPFGKITKYQQLAESLKTTIQSLVMNDPKSVPLSFFDQPRSIEFTESSTVKRLHIGREGEETVLEMERSRLRNTSQALSELVLPYYKMKGTYPGFDILSFNEDGSPIYIEVKTTEQDDTVSFELTKNEYDAAKKITENGSTYLIYHFSYWGTSNQKLDIYNFTDMLLEGRISPAKYICNIRPKPETMCGIVYYREKMEMSQIELANMTGISAPNLCKYEQGRTISVSACKKLSHFFNVTIDDLLKEYPVDYP